MKTKLEEAREIINEVDRQLIDLFIKRMAAVSMVAEYKMENDIPVLDSIREEEIQERNVELLSSRVLEPYYITFFKGVLDASKAYQTYLLDKFEKEKK